MRPFVLVRDAFVLGAIALIILAGYERLSWWWLAALVAVYGIILIAGASVIRWNFFIPALHHGARQHMQLTLTFDDGPAKYTDDILDILKEEGVTAAFFCIGKKIEAAPQIVQRCTNEGHLIGNHSYAHSIHFDWQSRSKMVAEMNRTNGLIKSITGLTPKFFRPPFGVTNPELSHAVTLTSMHTIGWSLRSLDTTAKDADKLLQQLLRDVRGGDVILLHDNVPLTVGFLTAFIRGCREKGFTFVRLDAMLGIEAYA